MTSITEIPDDRELTNSEACLVRWLLNHGTSDAAEFVSQLDKARVASRCYCGCASIDFAIDGIVPEKGKPISILADYEWTDAAGRFFGVFVFSRCGLLAGLEIWSQDGLATANVLPEVDQLRPIGTGTVGEPSHALEPAAGPVSIGKSSPPAQ